MVDDGDAPREIAMQALAESVCTRRGWPCRSKSQGATPALPSARGDGVGPPPPRPEIYLPQHFFMLSLYRFWATKGVSRQTAQTACPLAIFLTAKSRKEICSAVVSRWCDVIHLYCAHDSNCPLLRQSLRCKSTDHLAVVSLKISKGGKEGKEGSKGLY